MGKGKKEKFADIARYENVFEYPFSIIEEKPFFLKGKWREKYFKNSNPIVLELGCGKGEYTIELARLYPSINFIGVDIKGARMWSGATQALKDELKNVAFLRTNIEIIDRFFIQDEVQEIWLTFCDPQMKKIKKRLTSTFFMKLYRNFLIDNGIVHLKTDSNFLFTYTRLMVEKNSLRLEFFTEDLYHTEDLDPRTKEILSIRTFYESQFLERGISIKYMKFHLPKEGSLEESDIEIPQDEYRSFKRDQRSNQGKRK